MKPESSKLRQNQAQESSLQQPSAQTSVKQFESVEEIIRQDASTLVPPPAVETRLKQSLKDNPPPASWWKRFFSR